MIERYLRVAFSGRIGIALAVAWLSSGWNWLEAIDTDIERGNRAFEDKQYAEALTAYETALDRHGPDARIFYNIGAVLYKLAEQEPDQEQRSRLYSRAARSFRAVVTHGNLHLQSMAAYNWGNTLFQQGLYHKAVHAYRQALKANPQNDNARYNLQLAQEYLEADNASPPPSRPRQKPSPDTRQKGPRQKGHGIPSRPESQARGDTNPGSHSQKPADGRQKHDKAHEGAGVTPLDDIQQSTEIVKKFPDMPSQWGSPSNKTTQSRNDHKGTESSDSSMSESSTWQRPDARRSPAGNGRGETETNTHRQHHIEKKLDALERMSRELHRQKMRKSARRSGYRTFEQDW